MRSFPGPGTSCTLQGEHRQAAPSLTSGSPRRSCTGTTSSRCSPSGTTSTTRSGQRQVLVFLHESSKPSTWFQVIVLERNRRVAKAYARAPVLTVNGANDGFDGFRIGVNGFENPMRDSKTRDCKGQIGAGCKLKMDDSGNILVKRLAKSAIYVKNTLEENSVSNDILKLPGGLLEQEKPFKLFDMKKFQQNVNRCL